MKSEKRCPGCRETKPLEEYPPNSYSKSGRGLMCVACVEGQRSQRNNKLWTGDYHKHPNQPKK